ncbi:hypothetical protein C8Q77DRAFT_1135502 [Trametes polyzona]|nr:hypothetical protein C8Q77DRAFT_1135502 [Trametes polyzona]
MDEVHTAASFPHGPQRDRPTASGVLWGHLLRKTGSTQVPSSSATSSATLGKHTPPIAPLDKAGASTRILLHDTQAHLEKFMDRVVKLTSGVDETKRELLAVQKLYQDDHEHLMDRMTVLSNRTQTDLQKRIGTPAQSSEVRDVVKDLSQLSTKLGALDKRMDSLNALSQTQAQALQAIQEQQGQLLSALLPLLPLLQAVPLHIENARDRTKDSIGELRRELRSRDSHPAASVACCHAFVSQVSERSGTQSSGLPVSLGTTTTPAGHKKRRLETTLNDSGDPSLVHTNTLGMHARTSPIPGYGSVQSPDVPLAATVPPISANTPRRLIHEGHMPRSLTRSRTSRRSERIAALKSTKPVTATSQGSPASPRGLFKSAPAVSSAAPAIAPQDTLPLRFRSGSGVVRLSSHRRPTVLPSTPSRLAISSHSHTPLKEANPDTAPRLRSATGLEYDDSAPSPRSTARPRTPASSTIAHHMHAALTKSALSAPKSPSTVTNTTRVLSMPPPLPHPGKPMSLKDRRALIVDDQQVGA